MIIIKASTSPNTSSLTTCTACVGAHTEVNWITVSGSEEPPEPPPLLQPQQNVKKCDLKLTGMQEVRV